MADDDVIVLRREEEEVREEENPFKGGHFNSFFVSSFNLKNNNITHYLYIFSLSKYSECLFFQVLWPRNSTGLMPL